MGTFAWFWSGQIAVDARLAVLAGVAGILLAVTAVVLAVLWRRERRGRQIEAAKAETGAAEVGRLSGELDRFRSSYEVSRREADDLRQTHASLSYDFNRAKENPSLLAATFLRQYVAALAQPRERLETAVRDRKTEFVAAVDAATIERAGGGLLALSRSATDSSLDDKRRRLEELEGSVDDISKDAARAATIASELADSIFDASVWTRRVDRLVGEPERAVFSSVMGATRW